MWDTHTHNGILFNYEKDGNPAICDDTDEHLEHYVKWEKSEEENKFIFASFF